MNLRANRILVSCAEMDRRSPGLVRLLQTHGTGRDMLREPAVKVLATRHGDRIEKALK
jgi:hypothetical protein